MDKFGILKVRTPDPKCVHRLVISEISDIKILNPKWIDPLITYMQSCKEHKNRMCCAPLRVIDNLLWYLQNGGSLSNLRLAGDHNGYFRKMTTLITAVRGLRLGQISLVRFEEHHLYNPEMVV